MKMLLSDLGRQLGSLVDQVCLLGQGPTASQPTGVAAAAGVNQIATFAYNDFAHAERLTGDQRVALDSYAVITSPTGKEYLQTTPVVVGFPVFVWDKLTNPKSSTEVTDNKAYCGSWQMLTIAIWGVGSAEWTASLGFRGTDVRSASNRPEAADGCTQWGLWEGDAE